MPDSGKCSHPRMCPPDDSFSARIKQEKLSLEPPPPSALTRPETMKEKRR